MLNTVRIVLADDHPLIHTGIRATLGAEIDLQLVGEAAEGEEARRICVETRPDVLLLDLSMPGPPPGETVDYVRAYCPSTKILILTAYDDDAYVRALVNAGVAGYMLKDEAPESLVRAVRAVAQGDGWFSRSIVTKLSHLQRSEKNVGSDLNHRERQVLRLMMQGHDNATIASELSLAVQTVNNYVSRLYTKLQVKSRAEALVYVRKSGILLD